MFGARAPGTTTGASPSPANLSTGLFGSSSTLPALSSTPGSTSLFGTSTQPTATAASTSLFGGSSQPAGATGSTLLFGTPSPPVASPATTSLFGGAAQPALSTGSTSIFGTPTPTSASVGTTSLMGTHAQPAASTGSISSFGAPSQAVGTTVSSSLFGTANQPGVSTNTTSLFGGAASQPAASIGSTSLFGVSPQPVVTQPSTSLFGAPTQPVVTQPSTSLFGTSTQPTAQASTSLFGTPTQQTATPTSTSLFGASLHSTASTGSTSFFGTTAQAAPSGTASSFFGTSTQPTSLFGATSALNQPSLTTSTTTLGGAPASQQSTTTGSTSFFGATPAASPSVLTAPSTVPETNAPTHSSVTDSASTFSVSVPSMQQTVLPTSASLFSTSSATQQPTSTTPAMYPNNVANVTISQAGAQTLLPLATHTESQQIHIGQQLSPVTDTTPSSTATAAKPVSETTDTPSGNNPNGKPVVQSTPNTSQSTITNEKANAPVYTTWTKNDGASGSAQNPTEKLSTTETPSGFNGTPQKTAEVSSIPKGSQNTAPGGATTNLLSTGVTQKDRAAATSTETQGQDKTTVPVAVPASQNKGALPQSSHLGSLTVTPAPVPKTQTVQPPSTNFGLFAKSSAVLPSKSTGLGDGILKGTQLDTRVSKSPSDEVVNTEDKKLMTIDKTTATLGKENIAVGVLDEYQYERIDALLSLWDQRVKRQLLDFQKYAQIVTTLDLDLCHSVATLETVEKNQLAIEQKLYEIDSSLDQIENQQMSLETYLDKIRIVLSNNVNDNESQHPLKGRLQTVSTGLDDAEGVLDQLSKDVNIIQDALHPGPLGDIITMLNLQQKSLEIMSDEAQQIRDDLVQIGGHRSTVSSSHLQH